MVGSRVFDGGQKLTPMKNFSKKKKHTGKNPETIKDSKESKKYALRRPGKVLFSFRSLIANAVFFLARFPSAVFFSLKSFVGNFSRQAKIKGTVLRTVLKEGVS